MKRLLIALIMGVLTASCAIGADWSKPTLTDTYANFLNYLDARLDEVAHQFSQSTPPTNQPIGTIRWSTANARWEAWNGSTWVVLAAKYMLDVDSVDGYHVSTSGTVNSVPAVSSTGVFSVPGATISKDGVFFTTIKGAGAAGAIFTNPTQSVLGVNIKYNASGQMVGIGNGWASRLLLKNNGDLSLGRSPSLSEGVPATWTDYRIWSEYNDGADSGLDSDKLDGKHWVSVASGSATVGTGVQTLATLRTGATTGSGTLYRYAVRSAGVTVSQGWSSTATASWIDLATGPSNDLLRVNNATGGSKEFFYSVDVWE